nr:hypothetical protein [Tanacetum cinerariifolium]
MTTHNAGRRTTITRGGSTSGHAGRGGDHVSNQGFIRSQNGDTAYDSMHEERNVNVGNIRNRCSYKKFVACKPKEFDGKGGAVAYIRWVEKMESVQDMSGCRDNKKVKYIVGLLTSKALTWWNFKIQTRGRSAAVGMTWKNFKALMREEYYPSNEMQRLETKFWNHSMVGAGHSVYTGRFYELVRLVFHLVTSETKRIERYIYGLALQIRIRNEALKRNGGESSKEGNVKGDIKRARTGNVFATTTNPVRREYTGTTPKYTNSNFYHIPESHCRMCTNCNRFGHFAKDYRVGPRMMNPLNAKNPTTARGACFVCGGSDHNKSAYPRLNRAQVQRGNRLNQAMAIEGGQARGNNRNLTRGRAFVIGADEARQDPNIMMSMFSLNNHYATMLFDSGFDYRFISTTFVPLLDIEPISLGTDWLSRHRAQIVCFKREVRIPLPHGEMLRVYGELPEEKVFPDDLSGLPPSREVKFCINLIPGAMPVAKSPYHLTPTEMEELSNQLREL